MAASGVGAAIGLAALADEIAGEIVFLGTPAEKRGSGKQFMIEDGLFEGIDAALLFHPCDRSHVGSFPLASEDVEIVFHGLQAHAAADPWRGKNALDAMILLFASVGLWRQQLPTDVRIHGIIQEGGTAANIIPDRTRAWFMLRSPDQARYASMKERFRGLVEGAALTATDTSVRPDVLRRRDDDEAERDPRGPMGRERGGVRGRRPGSGPEQRQHGHGRRSAGRAGRSTRSCRSRRRARAGHSILFRDAAATPKADRTTLLAAILVAQVAWELFADPELVAAAWRDFRAGRLNPPAGLVPGDRGDLVDPPALPVADVQLAVVVLAQNELIIGAGWPTGSARETAWPGYGRSPTRPRSGPSRSRRRRTRPGGPGNRSRGRRTRR